MQPKKHHFDTHFILPAACQSSFCLSFSLNSFACKDFSARPLALSDSSTHQDLAGTLPAGKNALIHSASR
jgi:hypothetical protein